ncbi:hypothetical protein [Paenibacillus sp. OK003]|uniref:hypothetical protein n=1 Tax=Paenibacillus sp. OK003 TaxID=1884380 RepID=UPI0008AC263D|nr:hypothetical protein [Paenibacillus sp. OK003]SEL10022.1 hypothetical protein SAMN05518856_107309 [Paenibacillus sp. OK003]
MEINKEIINTLNQIQWFSNCGTRDYENENILYASSWSEATYYYNSQKWEETTLEARNQFTSFLHKNFIREYSDWNELIKEAKTITNDCLDEILEKTTNEFQLDSTFIDCVRWDILEIIMKHIYSRKLNRKFNGFYSDIIFNIYSKGHLPCGWEGKWPTGKLVIY